MREDTRCDLCGEEREDLENFLLDCRELEEERRRILRFQRPREEKRTDIIGGVMFDVRERKNLVEMWKRRARLLGIN